MKTNVKYVSAAAVILLFALPAPMEASHTPQHLVASGDSTVALIDLQPTDIAAIPVNPDVAVNPDIFDAPAEMLLSGVLDVQTGVDTVICATGSVQCGSQYGHTFAAASSANHNPIRISVIPVLDGHPVAGLSASDFHWDNRFTPAGATAAAKFEPAGCSNCFQQQDGHYVFFVHPANNGAHWKAGHYFAKLEVSAGGAHGTALVEWSIS